MDEVYIILAFSVLVAIFVCRRKKPSVTIVEPHKHVSSPQQSPSNINDTPEVEVTGVTAQDLLREPATKYLEWVYRPEIMEFYRSPDQEHIIVVSHRYEATMMFYIAIFSLIDDAENILQRFEPLVCCTMSRCSWSDDGRYFALQIGGKTNACFIYDTVETKFALLRLAGVSQITLGFDASDNFNVYFFEQEVQRYITEVAARKFSNMFKREAFEIVPVNFPISNFEFYDVSELPNIQTIIEGKEEYKFKPEMFLTKKE